MGNALEIPMTVFKTVAFVRSATLPVGAYPADAAHAPQTDRVHGLAPTNRNAPPVAALSRAGCSPARATWNTATIARKTR
jgi:hypothetical protein